MVAVSRLRVRYSPRAVTALHGIGWQRTRRIERALGKFAGSGAVTGLARIETALDLAACEVLKEEGTVLVYAVVPKRELLEQMWGGEFERRLRQRRGERLVHGRWS